MTYILGLKNFGITSIICDTRVTLDESRDIGENTALKSGFLFPGCIYGASGNVDELRKFVILCKEQLTKTDTLPNLWEKFLNIVKEYPFSNSKSEQFQLLLSSRCLGEPSFYILDSAKGRVTDCESPVTIGSGRLLLDEHLNNLYKKLDTTIEKLLKKGNAPKEFYPYFYCLWLMERVQGMEVSLLEKVGVGGCFHFTSQTKHNEFRQGPAVYVLNAGRREGKTISIEQWSFRIAFVRESLVVHCPIKKIKMIIVDSAAWPTINSYSKKQLEEYRKTIEGEVAKQNYYTFCGFGFVDPNKRYDHLFHITTEKEYVITENGDMREDFKRALADKFSR